jgi:hypothetical protein
MEKENQKVNTANRLLSDELPPMNVEVEALFRYSKDWGKILGEHSVREEIGLTRRIPSNDNSKGWQWSDPEIKTYSTGEVIWWRYPNTKSMQLIEQKENENL